MKLVEKKFTHLQWYLDESTYYAKSANGPLKIVVYDYTSLFHFCLYCFGSNGWKEVKVIKCKKIENAKDTVLERLMNFADIVFFTPNEIPLSE